MSIALVNHLLDIADELVKQRLYRFAEQLHGTGISISNHIAVGAGARSTKKLDRCPAIA